MQTQTVTSEKPVEFFDVRREPLRGESRARIRVTTAGGVQIGETYVPAGTHELLVWESQLALLEQQVEDRHDLLKIAQEKFDRDLAKVVGQFYEAAKDLPIGKIREIAKTDPEMASALSQATAANPDSVEGQFYELADRSLRSLRELKVLERGIPEPGQALRAEQNAATGNAIAAAIKAGMSEALADQKAKK